MSASKLILSLVVFSLIGLACGNEAPDKPAGDQDSAQVDPGTGNSGAQAQTDIKAQIKDSIDRGIRFVRKAQDPQSGAVSFMPPANAKTRHPGITAMALLAYLKSPRKYTAEDGPFVRNALDWLASLQKEDGSIYERDSVNYCTSLAMTALIASGEEKYAPHIEKAKNFILRLQAREETGYKVGDKFYGGVGYGGDERPDLSNAQFAIEAVKEAGLPKDHPFYVAALKFLEATQNWSETNPQTWKDGEGNKVVPGNDGGAMYLPGESKAGIEVKPDGTRVFRSYGSMSYALLKSFIFCGLDRRDSRVKAVVKWCQENFDVAKHPGFVKGPRGNEEYQGLYYYYFSMAKALQVYGDREFKRQDGTTCDWARELAEQILSQQAEDGSFVNDKNGRWQEQSTVICTCYAIRALEECYDAMK